MGYVRNYGVKLKKVLQQYHRINLTSENLTLRHIFIFFFIDSYWHLKKLLLYAEYCKKPAKIWMLEKNKIYSSLSKNSTRKMDSQQTHGHS